MLHRSFVQGDRYGVGVWCIVFLVVIFTFVKHRSDRCRFKALNGSLSFLPRRVSCSRSPDGLVFFPGVLRFWKFEHLFTIKVHDSYIAYWWFILSIVIVLSDALFWRRHNLLRVFRKPIFVAKESLHATTIFGLFVFNLSRGRERRGGLRCNICLSLSWYIARQESWGQGNATFPWELFDTISGHCSLSRSYLLSVVSLSVSKTAWGSWRQKIIVVVVLGRWPDDDSIFDIKFVFSIRKDVFQLAEVFVDVFNQYIFSSLDSDLKFFLHFLIIYLWTHMQNPFRAQSRLHEVNLEQAIWHYALQTGQLTHTWATQTLSLDSAFKAVSLCMGPGSRSWRRLFSLILSMMAASLWWWNTVLCEFDF